MIDWTLKKDEQWQSLTMEQKLIITNKCNSDIVIQVKNGMKNGRIWTEIEIHNAKGN